MQSKRCKLLCIFFLKHLARFRAIDSFRGKLSFLGLFPALPCALYQEALLEAAKLHSSAQLLHAKQPVNFHQTQGMFCCSCAALCSPHAFSAAGVCATGPQLLHIEVVYFWGKAICGAKRESSFSCIRDPRCLQSAILLAAHSHHFANAILVHFLEQLLQMQ